MKLTTIFRKAKTVVLHPLAAIRVAGYHVAQWQGRRRLVALGLKDQLERVESKCTATGALPPNYTELWYLYQDVRRLRPEVIYEFGSGLSTNIMAEALAVNAKDGGVDGRLYSFESEKQWWEVSDQWLDNQTRSFVELIYSPVRVEEMFGAKVFKYSGIPDLVPDLVYLDGPRLTPEVRAAADMLDFEPSLKPGFWLVIDGRRDNAEFLNRHLKRRYKTSVRCGFMGGAYLQRCYKLQGESEDR